MVRGNELCLLVFVLWVGSSLKNCVRGAPQVPCYFIFGDSGVDNGNNNFLHTEFKVNYKPYGIDFPNGPTGRFCNGRTPADVIGEILGFEKFIPPFATAAGMEILNGLNYASGTSGIRDETGKHWGDNVSLNKQLFHHGITVSRIVQILGTAETASNHLNQCLYLVSIASNDYMNNYFVTQHYVTSRMYTPKQYAQVLIEQYSQQLRILYNLGARKVVLTGIPIIGCTPNAVALYGTNGSLCFNAMNDAVQLFNGRLKELVYKLNKKLTDATFIYVDAYGIFFRLVSWMGFNITIPVCCQAKKDGLCIPSQTPCQYRNQYLFWDDIHPTELVNQFIARMSYSAIDPSDTYPLDIQSLIHL